MLDINEHSQIEGRIRNFLTTELMKEKAKYMRLDDILDLDSLEHVEVRLFLEEEFELKVPDDGPQIQTLGDIIRLIDPNQGNGGTR